MLGSGKNLSLVEQKKLQWAKEREEMIGLCGLWGRPRNNLKNSLTNIQNEEILTYNKNNLLPPLTKDKECEESVKELLKEEESETSGYLSDSPKHLEENLSFYQNRYFSKDDDLLNNEEIREEVPSNGKNKNYWAEKKMYKNYKNENWAHQNNDLSNEKQKIYQINKNYWYGTPESVSSDDGYRLRWGDRGVGVGHLWEPVINAPGSRLPQLSDSFRQTPKWVEKGLKNCDGSKADILIINHPDDDEQYIREPQKNFMLGQNAPIPADIIEERERKRKKALEHQNAIKKQLEEREIKRKLERENRLKEEKLEEERIKKEQELERQRYEEELKKIKEKAEMEKKKEEAMKEAIEAAEIRAREEKRRNKRHVIEDINQKNLSVTKEKLGKMENTIQSTELPNGNKNQIGKSLKGKKSYFTENCSVKKEQTAKALKDSSSQFEEIQLANSFQFLNMNGVPVDGGLAFMLESQAKNNNFFMPPDGMQLALLMSPRNPGATNRLVPLSPPVTGFCSSAERTLTPSKYRIAQRLHYIPSNKSTQTDIKLSSNWLKGWSAGKRRKVNVKYKISNENESASQKSNTPEKHNKHVRPLVISKYRSRPHPAKANLEDRPKWGINRPSVQYKKQSEKDPYYQKKLKERLKLFNKFSDNNIKNEEKVEDEEKELDSVSRLLDFHSDDDEKLSSEKRKITLENGFRMISNSSSPIFVPIDTENELKNIEIDSDRSNDPTQFETDENEVLNEDDDDDIDDNDNDNDDNDDEDDETVVPGSVGFLTQTQLNALQKITNLREGLKILQKSYSDSRSITPLSTKSTEA